MKHLVQIFYLDDKQINIILEEEETVKFISCLEENKAYWSNENKSVFLTPLSQIRYANVIEYTKEMEEADLERAKAAKEIKEKAKEEVKKK